jgi:hypothetical protein
MRVKLAKTDYSSINKLVGVEVEVYQHVASGAYFMEVSEQERLDKEHGTNLAIIFDGQDICLACTEVELL